MSTPLPTTNSCELPQISRIVSSYLKRHHLSSSDIEAFQTALKTVVRGYLPEDTRLSQSTSIKVENLAPLEPPEAQLRFTDLMKQPAVPIENSVCPDFIICLEDGAQVTALGPYIKSRYALTPAQYRKKWGLPDKYPMTAPNHARNRTKPADGFTSALQEDGLSGDLAGDIPDAVPSSPAINDVELDHGVGVDDLKNSATERPIVNAGKPAAFTEVTPVNTVTVPELNDQKPVQKSRPILKLAAWQKPPTPEVSTEAPIDDQPASSSASREEATPVSMNNSSKPTQENLSRGFRYPVHRYSR